MKKLCASGLVFVVLSSMIYPAIAENITIDSWTISYEGTDADNINRENNFAELTDEHCYEGEYALYIKCPDGLGNASIVVKNKINEELPAGVYEMSFYAKGSFSSKYAKAGLGDSLQYNIKSDFTVSSESYEGADGKNWKKYTKSVEYNGGSDELCFVFEGYTTGWVIDNVSITDENGIEYVKNPSFESLSETVDSEYNSAEYDPMNFMAIPFSGGLAVTWRNPSTKNLKKMELYNITNNKAVLLSDSFDNTPSTINTYKAGKLTNGANYQYKLHISYRDGTEKEYFTYGTPSANDVQYSPWSVTLQKGNDFGYSPISVSIDATEKHEGDASMKIISNYKSGSNVYALLGRNINVEIGEDYILTFWAKAINSNTTLQITNNWNLLDGNTSREPVNLRGTYDWQQFTVHIKSISTSPVKFFFVVNNSCDSMWLDDFSLMKEEDGSPTGEELFTDGGFEDNYSPESLGVVKGLSAESGDEAVNISWSGTESADSVKLYEKTEEGYCFRGYIHPSMMSITIGNLTNEAEHTFALSCVDKYGNEGELTEVSAYVSAPDFKIYETKLYKGKNEVTAVDYGVFTVETRIRNNRIDEDVPVCQITALYKGNILKKFVRTETNAAKLAPTEISTKIKTDIEIPEEEHSQYHIEVFLWNSKSGMMSLRDHTEFEQTE